MSKYSLAIKKKPDDTDIQIAYFMKTMDNGEKKQKGVLCVIKKQKGKTKKQKVDPEIEKLLNSANLSKDQKKLITESMQKTSIIGDFDYTVPPCHKLFCEEINLPSGYSFQPMKRSYECGERDKVFLTGISGAGKSYWIGQYLKDYKKKFPKREIVVFSGVDKDKAIDVFDPIRIDRETLLSEPMTRDELEDTCCIFDDTNSIPDQAIALAIRKVRDEILEMGRHSGVTVLCTSHMAMDSLNTKYPIRESDNIVLFPRGNQEQIANMFEKKLGFSRYKDLIDHLINLNQRWICYHKSYPSYILTKKHCMLKK
jgi:hypothetical protein